MRKILIITGILLMIFNGLEYQLTEKELLIKKTGYNDLYYLTKYILGYDQLVYRVHKPLCDFIQNTPGDVLDLEPRGHFKTTCGTIGYSIFNVINHPDISILVNHKILAKAKDMLAEIIGHFEKNKLFRHFYGDWVSNISWGQYAITVNKRGSPRKEPTISIGAIGHEATSSHYDIIINDDIAGLKDRYSIAERENTLNYYKAGQYLKKGEATKEINFGTRWNKEDVYNYIIEKRKNIKIRIKTAEIAEGRPYFPERFSWEKLKEMQAEDPSLYSALMLNNPQMVEGMLYPLDKLKFYQPEAFEPGYNIGYVDPAFGKSEKERKPCYFALVILSQIEDQVYVVDWITNRESPEQNEALIVEKAKEWGLRRLGVESNAAQSVWCKDIEKALHNAQVILDVEPINHNENKDRRIESMHGTVVKFCNFRADWDQAYPEAMSQLINFPQHKYKDAPDALEGGLAMIMGDAEVRIR